MFVFTAKVSKRRITAILLALVIVIAAIVLLFRDKGDAEAALSLSAAVRTNDDRVKYLSDLGWVISPEPLEEASVVIPEKLTEVSAPYAELQTSQGFDLEKYAGKEATRYTYEVLNYPSEELGIVADLLVYRGRIIAGDVQSVSLNGFMQGLTYPEG